MQSKQHEEHNPLTDPTFVLLRFPIEIIRANGLKCGGCIEPFNHRRWDFADQVCGFWEQRRGEGGYRVEYWIGKAEACTCEVAGEAKGVMNLHIDGVGERKRERYHGGEDAQVYEVTKVCPGAEENHEVGDHDRRFDVIEQFGGLLQDLARLTGKQRSA